MKKFKNNKGITLIALIITIIVMLILVGVTINVAINGGLFDTARDAKLETIKAQEQEELAMTAIAVYDVNNRSIDSAKLETAINALDTEYVKDSTKTTDLKYVTAGPSGTIWQIDLTTAEVKEYEESIPDPEPPVPTYPLSGKTFKIAYMNSEDYNLVFSDTSFTFAGITGSYEYDSETNRITGSITFPGESEATNIDTELYTSGNNSYFGLDINSSSIPMSLNGSTEGLMPFSGQYSNDSNSLSFNIDEDGYAVLGAVMPCCYFEQNNRLYVIRCKFNLFYCNS